MADKKGKRKNRKVVQMSKLYQGPKAKNKVCPKCGPGVFMAEHKNRISCGKCGYTEFKK
ncbi:MAG: 30S ribosomal protein S27ae [Candidatus Woesearchaeota archaeon]